MKTVIKTFLMKKVNKNCRQNFSCKNPKQKFACKNCKQKFAYKNDIMNAIAINLIMLVN